MSIANAISRQAMAIVIVAFVGLAGLQPAIAQKAGHDGRGPAMYKWVDEQGVTHYGDMVPPQFANQEKKILNAQGIQVGVIPGLQTPEQLAEESNRHAAEEQAHSSVQRARERDQHLLATYLSVEEIQSLRDRRFEIIDAQARVTQQYLEHLIGHENSLVTQAQRSKPYATSANAAPLPDRIAEDLVRTTLDIQAQSQNLQDKHREGARVKAQFDADMARFKELKKG